MGRNEMNGIASQHSRRDARRPLCIEKVFSAWEILPRWSGLRGVGAGDKAEGAKDVGSMCQRLGWQSVSIPASAAPEI